MKSDGHVDVAIEEALAGVVTRKPSPLVSPPVAAGVVVGAEDAMEFDGHKEKTVKKSLKLQ